MTPDDYDEAYAPWGCLIRELEAEVKELREAIRDISGATPAMWQRGSRFERRIYDAVSAAVDITANT